MKKLKCYKRWPKNIHLCRLRLRKICKAIDKILKPETPVSLLKTNEGQKFYAKKFTEYFLQVGYRFDTKPEFKFELVNKLCGGGISIYFIYKARTGSSDSLKI